MGRAVVKIKDWDHMKYEYGLDTGGDINCMGCFTKEMEKRIPNDRIITVEDGYWKHFLITEDMVDTELDNSPMLETRKKLL